MPLIQLQQLPTTFTITEPFNSLIENNVPFHTYRQLMHFRETLHHDPLLVPTYSGHLQADDRRLIRLNLAPEQHSTIQLRLHLDRTYTILTTSSISLSLLRLSITPAEIIHPQIQVTINHSSDAHSWEIVYEPYHYNHLPSEAVQTLHPNIPLTPHTRFQIYFTFMAELDESIDTTYTLTVKLHFNNLEERQLPNALYNSPTITIS